MATQTTIRLDDRTGRLLEALKVDTGLDRTGVIHLAVSELAKLRLGQERFDALANEPITKKKKPQKP